MHISLNMPRQAFTSHQLNKFQANLMNPKSSRIGEKLYAPKSSKIHQGKDEGLTNHGLCDDHLSKFA